MKGCFLKRVKEIMRDGKGKNIKRETKYNSDNLKNEQKMYLECRKLRSNKMSLNNNEMRLK